ncbi:hypothetical protein BDA99DRAFT_535371 [Phascolomyces articulosus]|uniref:HMG box domain-containing protein n=1 Tax=Phascolomyces articulosus TaxID=60185 RepID=A0AAD5PG39_9FUNG|nr:hypothetical protein BDA99DRAFT_535371 [Phascolomyces articulosus]
MAEDKYRSKYKELKRRVRDIEEENDILHVRIHKARKSINRLRLERTFLLERMEKIHNQSNRGGNSANTINDSDHSDIGYDDEMYRSNQHGKRGRIDKMLKTPKKKKDPNAPKGPGNVFFLYCRLERDKIKDEFPQENLGDVTKLLGQKWKGLTKDEKQKYYDMYRKEMEEYEEAMKTYVANGGSANPVTSTDDPASQPPDDDDEEPVEDEEVAAAAEDAAAAAAVGISTMSSPTHLSSAASPPELHSDPIIPQTDEDGDIDMIAPAGGLATASSSTREVPAEPTSSATSPAHVPSTTVQDDEELSVLSDEKPQQSKSNQSSDWRPAEESNTST